MMDRLDGYFQTRQEQETGRVAAVLAAMTPRERKLVQEVAVMASVRAARLYAGPGRVRIPLDSDIVIDAISACLHMEDLYPIVARLERVSHRRTLRGKRSS